MVQIYIYIYIYIASELLSPHSHRSYYSGYTVQSTYNFTHAWHFLRGATRDCDACHAALQRGPHQIYGMGHSCGFSILPVAMAVKKSHGSSSSLHVQCDACLFYLLFVSYPPRMALIASIKHRQLVWKKISASNTYVVIHQLLDDSFLGHL